MEEQYRIAVFRWIEEQVQIHGDVLPRSILEKGFIMNNQKITLVGAQGIWKPRVFESIPLSITTVAGGPYDDSFSQDGFIGGQISITVIIWVCEKQCISKPR